MKQDAQLTTNGLTRRALLGNGACALVALSAAPLAGACAAPADEARAAGAEALALAQLPKKVAGVCIPHSPLALAAAELVRDVAPASLYNHCLRTYVFAVLLLERTATKFDAELVFVGSALHDLGLVDSYMTETGRFEVDGADAAVEFLKQWHVPQHQLDTVWDAIALHTSTGIVTRKRPDIAAVSIGAGADLAGFGLEQLAAADVAEVLRVLPRLNFKQDAIQSMLGLCQKKPASVALTPVAEVGRRHDPLFPVPTLEDLVLGAPFSE
jgi:HD domain